MIRFVYFFSFLRSAAADAPHNGRIGNARPSQLDDNSNANVRDIVNHIAAPSIARIVPWYESHDEPSSRWSIGWPHAWYESLW